MSRVRSRFLSLVFLSLAGTATADERDTKIYPGLLCQPESNAAAFRFDPGIMTNSGSIERRFICPIVKDLNSIFNYIDRAHIVVRGADVDCSLRTSGRSASSFYSTKNNPTSIVPYPNEIKKLRYESRIHTDSAVALYFVCDVPPASGIISYSVTEFYDCPLTPCF